MILFTDRNPDNETKSGNCFKCGHYMIVPKESKISRCSECKTTHENVNRKTAAAILVVAIITVIGMLLYKLQLTF